MEPSDTFHRVATGRELPAGHPLPNIVVTEAHFFLPVEITQHEKLDREKCGAVDSWEPKHRPEVYLRCS